VSMPTPFRTGGDSTQQDIENRLGHIEGKVDRLLTIIEGDAKDTSNSMLQRLAVAEYKLILLAWFCGVAVSASVVAIVGVIAKFVFAGGFAHVVK
jgi:hypothetical protein